MTGAIFARGSCRALKWMALVGMVVALGAGQAAAQAATMASATYKGATVSPVTVTMSAAVTLSNVQATAFTLRRGTAADSDLLATGSSLVPSSDGMKLTVVLDTSLPSVTAATEWNLHYTAPTAPAGIWSDGQATVTASVALTQEASALMLPVRIADATATVGVAYTRTLDMATGGTGPYTYALIGAIVDTVDDTDRSLAFDAATRVLSGTPTAADMDAHVLTYTVTDSGSPQATVTRTFVLTIAAEADDPLPGVTGDAIITEITIDGATKRAGRLHVDEGSSTEVEVTVRWTNDDLRKIYLEDSSPDPVKIPISAMRGDGASDWLSPAEIDGRGEDVDLESMISISIPNKPSATASRNAHVTKTGTADISLHDDNDAEDEEFYIMVGGGTMGVNRNRSELKSADIVIDDDETQGFALKKKSGTAYEGGSDIEYELTADPDLVNLTLDVRLSVTDDDGAAVLARIYPVSPLRGTISADEDMLEVTIDPAGNDGDRMDDELMLHVEAISGRDDVESASADFMVLDVHKLPELTVSPMTATLEEGGEVELTLTLDRNPTDTRALSSETRQYTSEAVDVSLMDPSGAVKVMTVPVKFPEHNKKAPWTQKMKVKVMAEPNEDLDGERMVMLNAEVAGTVAANGMAKDEYPGVATLTIEEGTEALVWAKTPEEVEAAVMAAKKAGMGDDMMFTAGEMIELEGNDLFGSAQGVSVGYGAMVEGDAVSYSESGGVVTITADSMGMAKVTITARASRPSGAVMINDQTDPREASITIALEVGLVALSIELSGPEAEYMNIVEGMDHANGTKASAMVTATANRKVTEDVTVTLMRDRAMSSADDMDFTAEPITIMAGQTTGSTMVMAVADDMMENEGNMAEELVLYGMAADNAGEVTGHVKLYIWDAAVPALPVIAQLLLATFLAVGGYRRYRRR